MSPHAENPPRPSSNLQLQADHSRHTVSDASHEPLFVYQIPHSTLDGGVRSDQCRVEPRRSIHCTTLHRNTPNTATELQDVTDGHCLQRNVHGGGSAGVVDALCPRCGARVPIEPASPAPRQLLGGHLTRSPPSCFGNAPLSACAARDKRVQHFLPRSNP